MAARVVSPRSGTIPRALRRRSVTGASSCATRRFPQPIRGVLSCNLAMSGVSGVPGLSLPLGTDEEVTQPVARAAFGNVPLQQQQQQERQKQQQSGRSCEMTRESHPWPAA